MTKPAKKHEHYWHCLHSVYAGRSEDECSVVRFCRCGVRQHAYTGEWLTLPPAHAAHDEVEDSLNPVGKP